MSSLKHDIEGKLLNCVSKKVESWKQVWAFSSVTKKSNQNFDNLKSETPLYGWKAGPFFES